MGALGDLIRRLREERGLSQQALSARVGLTRAMISHIEIGRRRPTLRTLVRLARALGVQVSELARALEEEPEEAAPAQEPPRVSTPNTPGALNGMTLEELLTVLEERRAYIISHRGGVSVGPADRVRDLQDAMRIHSEELGRIARGAGGVAAGGKLLEVYRKVFSSQAPQKT